MRASLAIKILQFLPPDFEVDLKFPDAGLETVSPAVPKKPLTEGEMAALPMYSEDPCPGCEKGSVCRTPVCGRLKLPPTHPARKTREHWQT